MDPKIIVLILLVAVAIIAFASLAFASSTSGGQGIFLFGAHGAHAGWNATNMTWNNETMRPGLPPDGGCMGAHGEPGDWNSTNMTWKNENERPGMHGAHSGCNATNSTWKNKIMRGVAQNGSQAFNQSHMSDFASAVESGDFAKAKQLNGEYGLGGTLFSRLNESTFKTYSEMFSLQSQLRNITERLRTELGQSADVMGMPPQEGGMDMREPPMGKAHGMGNRMQNETVNGN